MSYYYNCTPKCLTKSSEISKFLILKFRTLAYFDSNINIKLI